MNEGNYDPAKHHIISNASCTTNCLAPAAKIVNDAFKIQYAVMTTIHSYTNDQVILDQGHKKELRRSRAAGLNMIPTSTGAAKAVALVIPELKGKFDGMSMRVPTPTVSIVDFVATVEKSTTKEELVKLFKDAADGPLNGILGYTTGEYFDPLVSMDFKGDPRSSIIDLSLLHGHGWQHDQGYDLVRQRVGLFLPHLGPCRSGCCFTLSISDSEETTQYQTPYLLIGMALFLEGDGYV